MGTFNAATTCHWPTAPVGVIAVISSLTKHRSPRRGRLTACEADSGARALGLDADSKLWKDLAALREALAPDD